MVEMRNRVIPSILICSDCGVILYCRDGSEHSPPSITTLTHLIERHACATTVSVPWQDTLARICQYLWQHTRVIWRQRRARLVYERQGARNGTDLL